MSDAQAQDLQAVINWCSSNLTPLVNSGKSLDQLTQACIDGAFPSGELSIVPDVVKDYIVSSLSRTLS